MATGLYTPNRDAGNGTQGSCTPDRAPPKTTDGLYWESAPSSSPARTTLAIGDSVAFVTASVPRAVDRWVVRAGQLVPVDLVTRVTTSKPGHLVAPSGSGNERLLAAVLRFEAEIEGSPEGTGSEPAIAELAESVTAALDPGALPAKRPSGSRAPHPRCQSLRGWVLHRHPPARRCHSSDTDNTPKFRCFRTSESTSISRGSMKSIHSS